MPVEKIIVGRNREDLKSFGQRGTAFLGKHIVGEGENAHLTNAIQMDVTRPHILLVCGKRGSGKSYVAGVVAEEITLLPPDIRNNLSVLMFDTMGIYWSMKQANSKDASLLKHWGMKPKGLPIRLIVPAGYAQAYEDTGIKVDKTLTLPVGELTATDWILTFGFSPIDEYGIVIERVIKQVKDRYDQVYGIEDILYTIQADKKIDPKIKDALSNRFLAAMDWGVFGKRGTSVQELFRPGGITVIDVSHFTSISHGWSVKAMVVGLLSRKIFQSRLVARKAEEFQVMSGEKKKSIPMIWVMIDEAHQFLPAEGTTAAAEPLHTLIKQGREPGISLLMITQRPNRLHEDALSQSDLVISHRLTAQKDLEALRGIMQTYMMEDIQEYINTLPRKKGTAIVLDDNSERIYALQVRPRFSWHAGGSPSAIKEKGLFD